MKANTVWSGTHENTLGTTVRIVGFMKVMGLFRYCKSGKITASTGEAAK